MAQGEFATGAIDPVDASAVAVYSAQDRAYFQSGAFCVGLNAQDTWGVAHYM